MSVASDMDKGTTLGDADGPDVFVETLGMIVPSFVDPREDLAVKGDTKFKRVNYHVPYNMRGMFRVEDWPEAFRAKMPNVRTDLEGRVLCSHNLPGGDGCGRRAVNRNIFCQSHGGALHRADRKLSAQSNSPMPLDRIEKLDRTQKFMQGYLSVEDLMEDEIKGNFVRNDQGIPIKSRLMGIAFEKQITEELHRRLNAFLREKAPDMLKVVVDIANNPISEDQDRFKAAVWAYERVAGKTPDVTVHAKTELPYEQILDGVKSGSREDYRKGITATRVTDTGSGVHTDGGSVELQIIDADVDESYVEFENEELDLDEDGELSEFVDESEVSDLGSGVAGTSRPGGIQVGRRDQYRWGTELAESLTGDDVGDSGISDGKAISTGVLKRVNEIDQRRADAKEIHRKRTVLRKRRFAAKANGATSLQNQPFALEYKAIKTGKDAGKWKCRLWQADQITPAIQERINSGGDTTETIQSLEAEADRMQAQLDQLRGADNG